MKKLIFIILTSTLLLAKDMLYIGLDANMYPKVKSIESNLAIKTLVDITLKTWPIEAGYKGHNVIEYDSFGKMIKDYQNKELDVVVVGLKSYSLYHDELKNSYISPFTIPHHKNQNVTLGFVVPSSKKDKKISYWKNKKIAIVNSFIIQDLTNLYFLKNVRKKMDKFASSLKLTANEGISVMDVFFKKVDIAIATKEAFDITNELNPQVSKRLAFVPFDKYLDIPIVIFFDKSISDKNINLFKALANSEFNSARGRQIRRLLRAHNIIKTNDKELSLLVKRYKKLRELSK